MEKSLMYVKNESFKNLKYHFLYSLPEGEGTPEECLEMAKDWIEKISNNEAQYVIAVHSHSDQPKIHAHIVTSCF